MSLGESQKWSGRLWGKKISCSWVESNSGSSSPYPSHYTHWADPAPKYLLYEWYIQIESSKTSTLLEVQKHGMRVFGTVVCITDISKSLDRYGWNLVLEIYSNKAKFPLQTCHAGPEGEQMYTSTLPSTSALDGGGWSTPRPGRFTPPGKTRSSLYRTLGGSQGRSEEVRKDLAPTAIRSPDLPDRSESLYRLSYPGPWSTVIPRENNAPSRNTGGSCSA